MNLPSAPQQYNVSEQQNIRNQIRSADLENWKRGRNVELALGEKFILRSPNGTRFYLSVDNAGTLTAVAV